MDSLFLGMPGRTFSQIYIHAVWCVKNREPLLTTQIRILLFRKIIADCKDKNIHFIRINGIEDHVHFLFQLQPTQTVSKIIKDVKGASSRWLNTHGGFEGSFIWQEGYSAFSVSPEKIEMIKDYIDNQEAHHANQSTVEEMEIQPYHN